MKKRYRILILIACALVLIPSLMGSLYAYMFRQTGEVTNTLKAASVSCAVEETFSGNVKSSITVRNTGNIDAYLRVRLVSYWVNDQDQIVPVASQMPAFTPGSNWVRTAEHTYCYKFPVAPGAAAGENLLASSMTLQKNEEGYRQVVEVFAEAIQAKPINAVQEAWDVSVSSDGTIGS